MAYLPAQKFPVESLLAVPGDGHSAWPAGRSRGAGHGNSAIQGERLQFVPPLSISLGENVQV